jgi:hypothetical protein
LPVFANAWIVQPQDKQPGDYPSGGPQAHNHDFWRAGAAQIDELAPDIYLPNFAEIAAMYSRKGARERGPFHPRQTDLTLRVSALFV